MMSIMIVSFEVAFIWMPQDFTGDYLVNIGPGSGLVPSGNKPLPEPILTQIYVTRWSH